MQRLWYAVKAQRQREIQASFRLAERGLEVYLPFTPAGGRRGQHGDGREPLFPGYFFAKVAIDTQEWLTARSAPGVAYFVGPPGKPTPLPEDLVELIRERAEARLRLGWQAQYERGDWVKIQQGPFRGLEAVFDRSISGRGRVRVFLKVVNRLVALNVELRLLAPMHGQRARVALCPTL